MGLGLAVIVSDCPSQVHVIEKHNCGLVFKAGDANDLADTIMKLYLDEKLRKKLGQNGKLSIQDKLNWEESSKSLLDLYDSFGR